MAFDWSLIIYVVVLLMIFPIIIILSLWQYRRMKRLMQNQALKHNGTVTGSFLLPQLKFSYRDLPVLITSVPGSKYRQAKTEVNVTLFKPVAHNLTIAPESFGSKIEKRFGAMDIQLGSDEFDREFLVHSDDEGFVRNFMNFALQSKFLEMIHDKPHITLQGTWLTIHAPKVLKTDEQYDRLIDLAFAVVDRLHEL
jgi:hypothetical protein